MNKRFLFSLLAALMACLLLAGCGSTDIEAQKEQAARDPEAAEAAYREVLQSDRITAEDALAALEPYDYPDGEAHDFVQMLEDLQRCTGRFLQSADYYATVSFYLEQGEPKCTVDYNNYMGELSDGDVTPAEDGEYLFEGALKGQLFEREHDFRILFGESQMRITWAENCDYTLTRDDGDSAQTAKSSFEDSQAYLSIQEAVDKQYGELEHVMVYDESARSLTVYVEAPDTASYALKSNDAEIAEAWSGVVETQTTLCKNLYAVAKTSGDVSDFTILWVFRLDSGNQYDDSDYVLRIQNGELMYNYATDS